MQKKITKQKEIERMKNKKKSSFNLQLFVCLLACLIVCLLVGHKCLFLLFRGNIVVKVHRNDVEEPND